MEKKTERKMILLVLLLLHGLFCVCETSTVDVASHCEKHKLRVIAVGGDGTLLMEPNGEELAVGCYDDQSRHENGFGKLYISSLPNGNEEKAQHFGAGFLEGYLTAEVIYPMYENMISLRPRKLRESNRAFFQRQLQSTREFVDSKQDSYGTQVGFILARFDGLVKGYARGCSEKMKGDYQGRSCALDEVDLWALNSDVDYNDIVSKLLGDLEQQKKNPTLLQTNSRSKGRQRVKTYHELFANALQLDDLDHAARIAAVVSRCVALIKLTTNGDLLIGHTTYGSYNIMIRLVKEISIAGQTSSFTGFPGLLASTDDFYYLHHSRMFILETSIKSLAKESYNSINPANGLASWVRCIAANQLATTGGEWAKLYLQENSGTNNCQWTVVDLKEFEKKSDTGLLTIIETMPGAGLFMDETSTLKEKGYFAGYNIPMLNEIREAGAYRCPLVSKGTCTCLQSFDENPKACMIKRDISDVETIDDMKHLIRKNEYESDPFSLGDPYNAIGSRADLKPDEKGRIFMQGALDGKVTSYCMVSECGGSTTQGEIMQVVGGVVTNHGKYPQPDPVHFPAQFKFNEVEWKENQWTSFP